MSSLASMLNSNVRAEMARRGVTQAQLAALTGLSQPAFSRRLTGDADWTVSEVYAIAQALNIPLSVLLPEAAVA